MSTVSYRGAGAATVWPCWCSTAAASATNVAGGSLLLCEVTSASATASVTVWVRWNQTEALVTLPARELTPEERQQFEASRARGLALVEEQRRRDEKLRLEREAAQKRAEELLLANLGPEQVEQYRKEKRFVVKGGDGASFELSPAWSGNVREVDQQGKAIRRFCIHPRETLPLADLMLAQKLMIETDPEAFRRIANVQPV